MNTPILTFYLNNELIQLDSRFSSGFVLLDWIRYEKKLPGTKIGCREGDCGACVVLLGEVSEDKLVYKSINSCLTPLGNVLGKHVVTIEGISFKDLDKLNLVQKAMVEAQGTQCGFCTPGFVMSMTGCLFSKNKYSELLEAIDGNICRCTGYKSIERACKLISDAINNKKSSELTISRLVNLSIVPEYFLRMKEKLIRLRELNDSQLTFHEEEALITVGGGTDLYVQRPDELTPTQVNCLSFNDEIKKVIESADDFIIGSGISFTEFFEIKYFNEKILNFSKFKRIIASTPIRNVATLGGNVVNASPIGDLSIILLAMNSSVLIASKKEIVSREESLKDFFLDYKKTDLRMDEIIAAFRVKKDSFTHFNFEKVSKRMYLDIASINTALGISLSENGIITEFHLSGGGLAPIPKYFGRTREYLIGKELNATNVKDGFAIAVTEISPISDIRGSKEYKSLLFKKLYYAHFITLFPNLFTMDVIFT